MISRQCQKSWTFTVLRWMPFRSEGVISNMRGALTRLHPLHVSSDKAKLGSPLLRCCPVEQDASRRCRCHRAREGMSSVSRDHPAKDTGFSRKFRPSSPRDPAKALLRCPRNPRRSAVCPGGHVRGHFCFDGLASVRGLAVPPVSSSVGMRTCVRFLRPMDPKVARRRRCCP